MNILKIIKRITGIQDVRKVSFQIVDYNKEIREQYADVGWYCTQLRDRKELPVGVSYIGAEKNDVIEMYYDDEGRDRTKELRSFLEQKGIRVEVID